MLQIAGNRRPCFRHIKGSAIQTSTGIAIRRGVFLQIHRTLIQVITMHRCAPSRCRHGWIWAPSNRNFKAGSAVKVAKVHLHTAKQRDRLSSEIFSPCGFLSVSLYFRLILISLAHYPFGSLHHRHNYSSFSPIESWLSSCNSPSSRPTHLRSARIIILSTVDA